MKLTRQRIKLILMLVDTAIITVSFIISYLFLSYYIPFSLEEFIMILIAFTLIYITISNMQHLYSKINRYYSVYDIFQTVKAVGLATLITFLLNTIFLDGASLRFYILNLVFTSLLINTSRIFWRLFSEYRMRKNQRLPETQSRILLVGAGQGGQLLISRIKEQRDDVDIFGLVDDDLTKKETSLLNVPVLGTTADIPKLIVSNKVDEIVVSAPSMSPKKYEMILDMGNEANIPVKKMPLMEDVMLGNVQISNYVDIDITDLLGRDEVQLDTDELDKVFGGKTVLITGAGGSIGSEIVRQLSLFRPARILLLGHGENSIYQIHQEMIKYDYSRIEFVPIIADIKSEDRLHQILQQYRPEYVFHAAAHKHVPLMEYNPMEAVKNNIYGTYNVAKASIAARVEKFIMVSTDKANNPTNVMGASKRIAEMIVAGMNDLGPTSFAAVRFGNVLGSRGSVVPLFKEQIRRGGPITVTDKRMTRYFMTIPEASRLVIQSGAYAKGGEIFVLDMGEPVKILDLAKKLIKLSGYTEDEIEIKETGIRPGEKLYEELLLNDETTGEKVFEKIYVGKVKNDSLEKIHDFLISLDLSGENNEELSCRLVKYVQH